MTGELAELEYGGKATRRKRWPYGVVETAAVVDGGEEWRAKWARAPPTAVYIAQLIFFFPFYVRFDCVT